MKQFTLTVAARAGVGRGASRRTRVAGRIPAIIYGKLNPPQTISIAAPEFTKLLKQIAGSAAIIELKENESDKRLSILQEIQRNPMTDQIVHVDLHEVSADAEMEIGVTVHTVGEPIGVRTENGILEIVAHQVRVRCLPKDLPPFIEVDVTELHLNESIHVSQLPKLPGVSYVDDPVQPVISCVEPVVEAEPTPAEAAPAEGAAAAAGAPAAAGAAPAAGAAGAAAPAAAGAAGAAAAKPGEKAAAGAKPAAAAPAEKKAPAKK